MLQTTFRSSIDNFKVNRNILKFILFARCSENSPIADLLHVIQNHWPRLRLTQRRYDEYKQEKKNDRERKKNQEMVDAENKKTPS